MALVTVGQAFSPNPERPPFYVDLPYRLDDKGEVVVNEPVFAAWRQHMPEFTVHQHLDALRRLRGIRFDSGWIDDFPHIPVSTRALSGELAALGVPHLYEEYNGDHRDSLWGPTGRLALDVFPYFWALLQGK